MSTEIDIIYCYRDRDSAHVQASLQSLALQEDKRFKVTFIDYGSSDANSKTVNAICKSFDFCAYYYVNAQGKLWNRSDALNHGILLSKSERLFFSDIDMLFLPGFVEHLHILSESADVHFFTVGYLNAAETKKAQQGKLENRNYKKSEDFATGMVLCKRKVLNTVNGFNSFYSLWGLEDNDLKRRIEQAGIATNHCKEVWLLHQCHASVPEGNSLPEGWIQFMKDNFEAQYGQKNTNGITQSLTLGGRQALEQFKSGNLQYKKIKSRKLHLRYTLFSTIQAAGIYAFSIEAVTPSSPGFVQNRARSLEKWFRRFGLHVSIRSAYAEQYLSLKEAQDEVYFVVKTLAGRIVDYYIQQTAVNIQFVVVVR